jgi:putative DNA primase/helicase
VATSEAQRDVIPDAVQGRFIQVGRQFYFPDGAEAFTDHGRRLTTRSENAVVIQSMVAIAQARGATELQVSGSEFFRKEAWFAARVAGLDVRGYTPSELEQERVARAVGRRDASARGEAAETNALQAPSATRPERAAAPAAPAASDLIVGRLIDHGVAPFQHRPDRAMSYYVRLETERGEVEHWGLDLERALRQSLSRPGIGDEVGLRKVGSDPVTVRASKRDAQGREIGQEAISARRNQWVLEKKEFVDERARMAALFRDASVSAAEATRRHPELDGSYVHLQMGNALAEERFKSKLHREQFVEHLREYLARRIEQGQPLDPVPLRPRRGDGQDPKVHDRDYAPAR